MEPQNNVDWQRRLMTPRISSESQSHGALGHYYADHAVTGDNAASVLGLSSFTHYTPPRLLLYSQIVGLQPYNVKHAGVFH